MSETALALAANTRPKSKPKLTMKAYYKTITKTKCARPKPSGLIWKQHFGIYYISSVFKLERIFAIKNSNYQSFSNINLVLNVI